MQMIERYQQNEIQGMNVGKIKNTWITVSPTSLLTS